MGDIINVVIVEDVKDIRESLQVFIGNTPGFCCAGAYATAEGAIADIPVVKPDVVLMDINLPGINGVEAVGILKNLYPDLKFVMCTVFEDDENIFRALQAGAGGYILKNNPPRKILDAIHDVRDGGTPMSAAIAKKVIGAFLERKPVSKAVPATDLTAREMEVLQLLSKGFHYKEVAHKLNVSVDTVRNHCRNIYVKLQVSNKVEAINAVFGER
jgi:DNA-binding NarL/FixJ family response regulator